MLASRAADGLGYATDSKVKQFLSALEQQYLALHPLSGEAWLDWYHKSVEPLVGMVAQEPIGAQRVIYNWIFRRVIQPTGQSLEPREVDQAMKNLKRVVDDLGHYYGVPVDLPPSPSIEPLGLLRAGQGRRPMPTPTQV